MQGTRLHKQDGEPDFPYRIFETPGAYGKVNDTDWFATTPNGLLGNLSRHGVFEHEDGTISVMPSILVGGGKLGEWHGYLYRGVWSLDFPEALNSLGIHWTP